MSVIARALIDTEFLNALMHDRTGALASVGADDSTIRLLQVLDVGTLQSFRGFIARLKHSFVWKDFPMTLSLLRASGEELQVFAAFASSPLCPAAAASRDEKTASFLAFLKKRRATWSPLRQDLFRHELQIWDLRQREAPPTKGDLGTAIRYEIDLPRLLKGRPSFAIPVRYAQYERDPRTGTSDSKTSAPTCLLYCRRKDGRIDVQEASRSGFQMLELMGSGLTAGKMVLATSDESEATSFIQHLLGDGVIRIEQFWQIGHKPSKGNHGKKSLR